MTNILSFLTLIIVINVHFYFVHGFPKSDVDNFYNELACGGDIKVSTSTHFGLRPKGYLRNKLRTAAPKVQNVWIFNPLPSMISPLQREAHETGLNLFKLIKMENGKESTNLVTTHKVTPTKIFRDYKLKSASYPFPYYTRDEWEADPPMNVKPLTKPVPYVVIHHTYIPSACNTTEECFGAMRSMQNYHNSLGWGDIGYNYCIGSMGGVYEGRGWNSTGIHAGRANSFSVGICLIGDWRVATPPEAMLETTKKLISVGVENGSISPVYKLVGHNQTMATECPGSALFNIISKWDHYTKEILKF